MIKARCFATSAITRRCSMGASWRKAPTRFFETLDKLRDVAAKLGRRAEKSVVCDGVFSMDGDLCPLPALFGEFGRGSSIALIVLDDAHGTGTLGASWARRRRSILELVFARERGLRPLPIFKFSEKPKDWKRAQAPLPDIVTLGTLSKALGQSGRFRVRAANSDRLSGGRRALFRLFDRPQSARCVGAALAALRIVEAEPERVQKCRDNAAFLARELGRARPRCRLARRADSCRFTPPIAPTALANGGALVAARGLWCPAIRPPTVKRARLRLTANASWDEDTLARIVAGWSGN